MRIPRPSRRHGDAGRIRGFLRKIGDWEERLWLNAWSESRKIRNDGEYAPRGRYNLWIVTPTDRARVASGDSLSTMESFAEVVLKHPKTPVGARVEIATEPESQTGRGFGYEPKRAWLKMGGGDGYRVGTGEWMTVPLSQSDG